MVFLKITEKAKLNIFFIKSYIIVRCETEVPRLDYQPVLAEIPSSFCSAAGTCGDHETSVLSVTSSDLTSSDRQQSRNTFPCMLISCSLL